ncbi:TolC family protein [Paraglaciecola sp. Hal342]
MVGLLNITWFNYLFSSNFCSGKFVFKQRYKPYIKTTPDLKSFMFKKEAAKGMLEQARIASPITVNLDVEDMMGNGGYSGINGMQTTLSISWLLEGDIIESKVGVANVKLDEYVLDKEIKALDVAAETAKIFITILSQKEQLILAKLARNNAKDVLHEISIRVKAGKLNVIDELRAKADLSKKELECRRSQS